MKHKNLIGFLMVLFFSLTYTPVWGVNLQGDAHLEARMICSGLEIIAMSIGVLIAVMWKDIEEPKENL